MTSAAAASEVFDNRADERSPGWRDLQALWAFRQVVNAFAQRTIRVRYKETFLGLLWVVIQPLSVLIPFIVVLGSVAHLGGGGVPYAAFATSVIPAWQAVASGLSLAAPSLVNEGPLLRKVYFPRAAPVAGAVGAVAFDMVVATGICIPIVYVLGGHPSFWVLLAPLLLLLVLVVTLATSLILAGLYIHYRDIRFLLPVLTQILLYASPVAYPLTVVPLRYRLAYAFANPLGGPLDGLRHTIATGTAPSWSYLAASALSAGLLLVIAVSAFGRLQRDAADLV